MSYAARLFAACEEENRREILRAIEPAPGGSLLDLGCCDGAVTMRVAAAAQVAEVHGVEFIEPFARQARARGVQVVVADLGAELPYGDASFDVVHANQVIEHLPKTDHFLREIHRVLKPGGYAVISTNNLSSWHNIASLTLGLQPPPCHVSDLVITGNPVNTAYDGWEQEVEGQQHLRVFTGRALASLAGYHGLQLERDRTSGYYPLPPRLSRVMTKLDRRHGAYLVQRFRRAEPQQLRGIAISATRNRRRSDEDEPAAADRTLHIAS